MQMPINNNESLTFFHECWHTSMSVLAEELSHGYGVCVVVVGANSKKGRSFPGDWRNLVN